MADIPLQFPNIGNALASGFHGAYYMQKARTERDENRRREEAQPYISGAIAGDQNALGKVLAGDPKTASAIIQNLGRLDEQKRKQVGEAATYTAQAANAILQADPKDRPAIYAQMRQQGIDRGYKMDGLPEQYSPQMDSVLRGHRAAAIPIVEWYKQDQLNQRHNTPGGGGGPTQIDLPVPGGGPMPAPAMPQGRPPMANAVPADVVRNTSVAGGPTGPMGTISPPAGGVAQALPTVAPQPQVAAPGQVEQGGGEPPVSGPQVATPPGTQPPQVQPPAGASKPRPTGPIWNEDPTQHGFVMRGERDKYGNVKPIVTEGGGYLFRNPQTGEYVIYKPQPQRQLPPGYQASPDGGLMPIPGGPADPTRPHPDRIPPGYQAAPGGGLAPIPGGPADPDVLERNANAKRAASEKAIPQTVTKGMQENVNALKQLDRVEALLNERPESIGGPGSVVAANIPGTGMIQNRWGDPQGAQLRALIADIGSMKIHDRSGAAVTVSEFPRLRPFIPTISDDAATVRQKLANFRAEYAAILSDTASYYGSENGFKPYGPAVDYLNGNNKGQPGNPAGASTPAASSGPKVGTVENGYRFKGGDPGKKENWELAK